MHTLSRMVLDRKFKSGSFEKNKARLAVCGNQQGPGIDYDDLTSDRVDGSKWGRGAILEVEPVVVRAAWRQC